jgi:flagellar hook-associated protein 3 FlgL
MSINGIGPAASFTTRTILSMREQLAELERQLATGVKSQTYGGLGNSAALVLDMRSQLSRIDTFTNTVNAVQLRVGVMNTSLERIAALRDETRGDLLAPYDFTLVGGGQTGAQRAAAGRAAEMLSLLNGDVGGRFLFSGRATDTPATDSYTHIIEGDGARAGLKQIIAERLQADQGTAQRGRLIVNAAAGSTVSFREDAVHPFGFKIAGASTTFGATVTGPAGALSTTSFNLGATLPPEGGVVRIQLDLPDGSSTALELTATTASPPGTGEFLIGATPAATAVNLASALGTELQRLARTDLAAASAVRAGNDFFATDAANPPQRVAGPPFASATAMVAGTPANTVQWYTGDNAVDSARGTALARVDDTITVSYGARANEEGIRWILQNQAVFAAVSFSESDPNARDRYNALANRIGTAMDVPAGMQQVEAIQTEIAGANLAAQSAKSRLAERKPVLQGVLEDVEQVSTEEVAMKLLSLNTRMQASLQTTAMIARLSLVNYI